MTTILKRKSPAQITTDAISKIESALSSVDAQLTGIALLPDQIDEDATGYTVKARITVKVVIPKEEVHS